jgi:hypothetical protein
MILSAIASCSRVVPDKIHAFRRTSIVQMKGPAMVTGNVSLPMLLLAVKSPRVPQGLQIAQ